MMPQLHFEHSRVLGVPVDHYIINLDREILHLNCHIVHDIEILLIYFTELPKEERHDQNGNDVSDHDHNADVLLVDFTVCK